MASNDRASDYVTEGLLLLKLLLLFPTTPPLLAPERVPCAANLFRRARNRGLVLSPGPLEGGGAGATANNRLGPPSATVTTAAAGPADEDDDDDDEGALLTPAGGRAAVVSVRLRPFLPPTGPERPLPSGALGLTVLGLGLRLGLAFGIGFKAFSPDPVLTPVAGGGTGLWGAETTRGVSKGEVSSP